MKFWKDINVSLCKNTRLFLLNHQKVRFLIILYDILQDISTKCLTKLWHGHLCSPDAMTVVGETWSYGFEWNIPTTLWWITMKSGINIHVPSSWTLTLAIPSAPFNSYFSNTVVFDQISAKQITIIICFNCTQCLMIITKGLHANMLNWDNNCDNQYTSHHTPQSIYPAVILVLSFVKYESWVKATSRITLLYFRHLLEQACFASTNSNGICTPIHSGSLPQFSWLSFIIGPSAQAAQTEQ